MSLDITLSTIIDDPSTELFSANITHNLGEMADEAGIYNATWRPEESDLNIASEIAPILRQGIDLLKSDPARFKLFDAANGWGTYDKFVPWLEKYLAACDENPNAYISVSR
jgi:hypothetical protein